MSALTEEALQAWRAHDGVNLFLLERIPDEGLRALTLLKNGQPSKGRDVARVFAHLHDVRVSHIPAAFRGEAASFERGATPGKAQLEQALRASGTAVGATLEASLGRDPRVKNYYRTGLRLLAYLIAHESHHRGQIMLALKQTGVRVPEELRFGIWTGWFDPA